MKTPDKFLIGIVAAVMVLVVVSFGLALTRPAPTYQPDDTPMGVAHNYLLALKQNDYARAYGYLDPNLEGYPDSVEQFGADITTMASYSSSDSVSLEVVSASSISDERSIVQVRTRYFSRDGLFGGSDYRATFEMTLRHIDGQWRIAHISDSSYWPWCWEFEAGCP